MIRPMTDADIPMVAEIERQCFPQPLLPQTLKKELDFELSMYFVEDVNGRIVGYCGTWIVEDTINVQNLAVHPKFRRLGIGSRLVKYLIKVAEVRKCFNINLEVRESNSVALSLYKKFEFDIVGRRPDYYENGETALLLERIFKSYFS